MGTKGKFRGVRRKVVGAKLPMENEDLTAPRYEYLVRLPLVESLLKDPEDAAVLQALFNIAVACSASLGAVLACYFVGPWWSVHVAGVVHLLNLYVVWLQRFVLGLHYATHRRLFVRNWLGELLNTYFASFFLCMFFGVPPGSYELHHIVMHHNENNLAPDDMTATTHLRRDSWWSFWWIWFNYPILTPMHLVAYAFRKERYAQGLRLAIFLPGYLALGVSLWFLATPALCLYVFLVPFFLTSILLMFGNFSQHIFVNPDDVEVNTYNLINTPENQVTFNDGYHQVHHDTSTLHWKQLPIYFMDHIDEYAARDVFVFQGIGFASVGLMVMFGQLDKLADYYVHYGQTPTPRTKEEIIQEFKRRLQPIKDWPGKDGEEEEVVEEEEVEEVEEEEEVEVDGKGEEEEADEGSEAGEEDVALVEAE